MSMILYGSKTSPFVRRIRIILENKHFTFIEVDIFGADKQSFNQLNPVNQIPILQHDLQTIWDSRQIFNYLNNIYHFETRNYDDENVLTAIEGGMLAGISLFLLIRSGVDITSDLMFIQRQKERIENVLNYLTPRLSSPEFQEWTFNSISLFCFLDWASFREIISIKERPECQSFMEAHGQRTSVIATQIPKV